MNKQHLLIAAAQAAARLGNDDQSKQLALQAEQLGLIQPDQSTTETGAKFQKKTANEPIVHIRSDKMPHIPGELLPLCKLFAETNAQTRIL